MQGPIRDAVRRLIQEQYRTRGEYGGTPWQELSDYTRKRKERAGKLALGPLKFSEKLYQSLTVIGHPDRRETITRMGYHVRTMVRSRTGFPYGASHQTGTEDGHVPARPIIPDPPPPEFMRELRNIAKGYLIEAQFGPGRARVR
jgi:hypothetical protein